MRDIIFYCEAYWGISILITLSSAFWPLSNCNAPLISSMTSLIVNWGTRGYRWIMFRHIRINFAIFSMASFGKLEPRVGFLIPMLPKSSEMIFTYPWVQVCKSFYCLWQWKRGCKSNLVFEYVISSQLWCI